MSTFSKDLKERMVIALTSEQAAKELEEILESGNGGGGGGGAAEDVTFNNAGTDLAATNAEDAIKEVNDKVNEKGGVPTVVFTSSTITSADIGKYAALSTNNELVLARSMTPSERSPATYNGIFYVANAMSNGEQINIQFSHAGAFLDPDVSATFEAGTDFAVGTDAEDQAQILATFIGGLADGLNAESNGQFIHVFSDTNPDVSVHTIIFSINSFGTVAELLSRTSQLNAGPTFLPLIGRIEDVDGTDVRVSGQFIEANADASVLPMGVKAEIEGDSLSFGGAGGAGTVIMIKKATTTSPGVGFIFMPTTQVGLLYTIADYDIMS